MKRIIVAAIAAITLSTSAYAQQTTAAPVPAPAAIQTTTAPVMEQTPAPVAVPTAPVKPLTVEERLTALEKDVQTIAQAVNALANNAASAEYVQGLAANVVSVQQQIVEMQRASIPIPKAVKATPKPAAKPAK